MLLNPHNVPHDETQPNARGGSAARGGRGVRGWTWECIPSCSVVAGPAVPHPAFNRHPVPFICWSTRDAISWPHVTNAETTSHGHPRRVKCRGGDVNRRLQNEPSFGVNHRKVNRIRFRRRSCRPEGVSHVLLPLSAYNVRQKMVLTSTVCLATVASSRFLHVCNPFVEI